MIRRITLTVLMLSFLTGVGLAQYTVTGVVLDKVTQEPLVGVSIYNPVTKAGVASGLDGSFSIKTASGRQKLELTYIGYLNVSKEIEVKGNGKVGEIPMESDAVSLGDVTVSASVAIRRKTPVALSTMEPIVLEAKLSNQEFPEVLKSMPGVYATKQGGAFGDSRINLRGFEAANIAVMINGVPVNDMEWGGVYWSNWANLGDVTRSLQVQRGLGASKIASPSVGGSINIVTKSTDAKQGGSVFYSVGNDGYVKEGFTFSTGLSENGWAITLLGAKNTGNGYIQGTEFEAYSYFVNISKLMGNQSLSFTGFGAPQWHNQRNSSDYLLISEWQKQPLKYKYNASYGFGLNGQRKQSSKNEYHKPQFSLNHNWDISEGTSLSTALYASIGNGNGYSGQSYVSAERTNWYGASEGVPNTVFRADDGTFDYGAIYAINKDNVNGSQYVMSKSVNAHKWYGLLSTLSKQVDKSLEVSGGIDLRYYKGTHTNVITDLYGGDFFIDNTSRSHFTSTDYLYKKLTVGDVVYRDYDGFVMSEGVFGQAEYTMDKLNTFIAGSVSNTGYWRYDRFYYEPAESASETVNFMGYTLKGGANYNLDAFQNIFANIGIISRAPFFSGGAFLQSTTSNMTNPNAVNEKCFSMEVGYGFRSRYLTANINAYRTKWIDKTMVRAMNADSPESLVINMEGLDALHQGLEFDFKAAPIRHLEVTGMLSLGDWKWDSNPTGYLYNRQGQPVDLQGGVVEMMSPEHANMTVNLKGIYVGNSAQTSAALGANYELLKGFRAGLDFTFWDRNYAYYKITDVSTSISDVSFAQPWKIPAAGVFDFNASYRFKLGDYNCTFNGNVNNLFDQEYIADATDGSDHTWKTAKVFYGFGRTWTVGMKFAF
jgi:outer membrane receptor for ferrienterochelin and colicin